MPRLRPPTSSKRTEGVRRGGGTKLGYKKKGERWSEEKKKRKEKKGGWRRTGKNENYVARCIRSAVMDWPRSLLLMEIKWKTERNVIYVLTDRDESLNVDGRQRRNNYRPVRLNDSTCVRELKERTEWEIGYSFEREKNLCLARNNHHGYHQYLRIFVI